MKLRNIVGVSLGLSAAVCAGLYEPSEKNVGVDKEKVVIPVSKKQDDFGEDLRDIIDDIVKNKEDSEFTVDVPVDEDGNIPVGFNFIGALRDCVESSGEVKCFEGGMGMQTCVGVNQDDANYPVRFFPDHEMTNDLQVKASFYFWDLDKFRDANGYEYDSNNAQKSGEELDRMCNDAIQKYLDSDKIDPDGEMTESIDMKYELFDLNSNFAKFAEESGYEIKDEGGLMQTMYVDGKKVDVIYMVDYSRTVGADDDWLEPSVELKIGGNDYFHNFATADEAFMYLQDTR